MSDPTHSGDFRSTAAFSQVAGVLGEFSVTILVMIITPEFLKEVASIRNVVIASLFPLFFYVASEGLSRIA